MLAQLRRLALEVAWDIRSAWYVGRAVRHSPHRPISTISETAIGNDAADQWSRSASMRTSLLMQSRWKDRSIVRKPTASWKLSGWEHQMCLTWKSKIFNFSQWLRPEGKD
jgi:hypothetical protein